ncbi:MAG: hypothetical protein ABI691_24300 [Ginsengibacter sp.]
MENTTTGLTPPPEESGSTQKKNTEESNMKNESAKDKVEADQKNFITEISQTENLIDPGNEHHHHADEIDKKIK